MYASYQAAVPSWSTFQLSALWHKSLHLPLSFPKLFQHCPEFLPLCRQFNHQKAKFVKFYLPLILWKVSTCVPSIDISTSDSLLCPIVQLQLDLQPVLHSCSCLPWLESRDRCILSWSDNGHPTYESWSAQIDYLVWSSGVSAACEVREGGAYKRKEILRFGIGGRGGGINSQKESKRPKIT